MMISKRNVNFDILDIVSKKSYNHGVKKKTKKTCEVKWSCLNTCIENHTESCSKYMRPCGRLNVVRVSKNDDNNNSNDNNNNNDNDNDHNNDDNNNNNIETHLS